MTGTRWGQYESKYDQPEDQAVVAVEAVINELEWDTVKGVIRPRLILLNAWLEVQREMSSEGHWGSDLAEELADDEWATGVLVRAGVDPVIAAEYALKEWK